MLSPAAVFVVALLQAPQDEAWIAAHPVAVEGLEKATCAAAAAPWVAFVQVDPLPESLREFHAPHPPWRLVRSGANGEPEVLMAADAVRGGGWGAPSFVAVAADGTVTATWRPGHEVLIAPPSQKAVLHDVPYTASRDCLALSTTWILHRDDRSETLYARKLTADGAGEDVRLDASVPRAEDPVFGAPWLAWIDANGDLVAIDVERREKRSLERPAGEKLSLEGIWNGRLVAHGSGDEPQLHVFDLARAVRWSLPAPASVNGCVPEGVFVNTSFWDPVDGTLRRVERSPGGHGTSQVLRRAPGVLWIRERSQKEWCELRLTDPVTRGKEPLSEPLSAPLPALPQLPVQPTGEEGDAARAAWNSMR